MLRLNLVNHPHFAGLAIRVLIGAEMFLGHLIYMGVGAVSCDLDDAAANLEVPVRVFGINHSQRSPRIAPHVLVLLSALGGVHDDEVGFNVAPYRRDLGLAIGHQGSQAGKSAFAEKIAILLRNDLRHEDLLRFGPTPGHYRAFSPKSSALPGRIPPGYWETAR